MRLCYNDYSSKRNMKGDGNMKVYILWYRNTFAHETHIWGIYGTEEKAQEARKVADKMDYITWINEEEVQ